MHISKHLGEIFLWQLLGIVVVLGFLVWLLNRYLKKINFSVVPSLTYKPINLLKTLITDPELRKRLLLTVGIMIVVQLLGYVPLLGINYNEMLYSIGESGSGSKLNFFLFRSPFRIFSLGMGPFIAACLLIQSGSVIIPPLRRYMFSEGRDRFKLEKYTLILTGIISIIHSVTVSRFIVNFPEYQQLITIPIPLFFLLSVLFLTGAVFVMIYMAVLISRYGIGNGFGMIILMGIFVKIFYNTKKGLGHAEFLSVYSPGVLILMCAAVVVILYCVYYITSREHRISLSHKEHMDIKIPISFTVTGLIPKSIAMSLVIFIITLIPGLREWRIIYYLLLAIALFFCMYVYMFIVLNPQYIAQMAKKYGYSLQDGDPEALKQSIRKKRFGIMLFVGILFILADLVPDILFRVKIPSLLYRLLAGILIFKTVGIIFDIFKQLEFYKKRSESSVKDWALCRVTFDEIEASFICGYLWQNTIVSLVKPYRLSWRMPIRTMIDKFEIYVPAVRSEEAAKLLEEKGTDSSKQEREDVETNNTEKE